MATFQEYHGISLADNSWIENLFVEQLVSDPVPVGPGRVWYNTTDKVFRQSTLDVNGGVIVRTFSTGEDLAAAVSTLTGDITTLQSDLATEASARQAADSSLQAALDTETSARVAADTALGVRIDNLGNAFNYVGTLNGGVDAASAFDMATLPSGEKDAGDYYKVSTTGYFKVGTTQPAFYAKQNDGLVFNLGGTVDLIDNTNSVVFGTADFIAVTGSADVGFTVDVDAAFKGRVSTLESGLAAETTARTAADTQLQANLDAEATARQAVAADLATEIARATGVEGSLASLTTNAKSNLVAAINELDTDIQSEAAARQAADAALQASIDAEATARADADAVLQSNIDAEASARIAGDAALQGAIDTEAATRAAADTTLQANLDTETTARQAADAALQTALNSEITARQTADAGLQSAIDSEAATRAAADSSLQSALNTETTARVAGDAALQAALDAEVTARTAADTAEASSRATADAALQAAIDAEATTRAAADSAINTTIGSLSSLTTTDKTSVVSAINEVKTLAGNGVASLVTQLNSYRYTFTSTVAATSFTITHGLGSTLVDVCVWIDRGDGVWRNDMAAVSIIDGTSIKVDLTAARNVRVTVEKMEAFA